MEEGDPSVRYNTNFDSSVGSSSELLTWEVAVIMIALILCLAAFVLIALFCHERKYRKVKGEEEEGETSIYTETKKPTIHRKIGVAHVTNTPILSEKITPTKSNTIPIVATEKKTDKNVAKGVDKTMDGALYLQRNAGLYKKGRSIEPLPPLPTSVFLISLPIPTDYNSIHPISERYI